MTSNKQGEVVFTVLAPTGQPGDERQMGSVAEGTLSDPRPIDPERFNLPIPPSGSSLLKRR